MKDEKNALVQYRMGKARETLEDARILANANRWNPCVNRLYYACFYAVSALLLRRGLSSSKHTGVRSLFNQHYVKPEKISKSLAQIYNDLFERRKESDYMDFLRFEEIQVRPWISKVETFVEHIASFIEKESDQEFL